MRIKKDLNQSATKDKGGVANIKPPAENLDAEIDAMIEEIYTSRKKSKTKKPAIISSAKSSPYVAGYRRKPEDPALAEALARASAEILPAEDWT